MLLSVTGLDLSFEWHRDQSLVGANGEDRGGHLIEGEGGSEVG